MIIFPALTVFNRIFEPFIDERVPPLSMERNFEYVKLLEVGKSFTHLTTVRFEPNVVTAWAGFYEL